MKTVDKYQFNEELGIEDDGSTHSLIQSLLLLPIIRSSNAILP
jgi:hypothetical protein